MASCNLMLHLLAVAEIDVRLSSSWHVCSAHTSNAICPAHSCDLVGTSFTAGNRELVGRYFKRDVFLSLRVTWGFIAKTFAKDPKACRELFFDKALPEADLLR